MADRRLQIVQLVATRYDLLWFPPGALRTSSGLAPNERVPCPACGHRDRPGWTSDRFDRRRPCVTCGGRPEPREDGQWRGGDRGRGFVFRDRMDALRAVVGHGETSASARPRKRVKCDRCQDIAGKATGVIGVGDKARQCPTCEGTGERDLHRFDLALDVTERVEKWKGLDPDTLLELDEHGLTSKRDHAGSYRELEAALRGVYANANKPLMFAALTANARQALRLLDELYLPPVDRQHENLTTFEQSLVELALAYIDTRMPDPIRVPQHVRDNAKELAKHRTRAKGRAVGVKAIEQRNKEIRRLARDNKPAQWIAAEYGLSVATVYAIVNGKGVAA